LLHGVHPESIAITAVNVLNIRQHPQFHQAPGVTEAVLARLNLQIEPAAAFASDSGHLLHWSCRVVRQ
jgi:hypothetical protein